MNNNNSSQTEKAALTPEEIEGVVTVTITSSKVYTTNYEGKMTDTPYLAKSYPVMSGMAYEVPVYHVKITSTARPGVERGTHTLRAMPVLNEGATNAFMSGLIEGQSYTPTSYDPLYGPHSMPNQVKGAFPLYGNFLVHSGPAEMTAYGRGGKGCVQIFDFTSFKATIVYMCGKHPSDTLDNTMSYLCKRSRITFVIEAMEKPPVKAIIPPTGMSDLF